MRKLVLTVLTLTLTSSLLFAQKIDVGLKGGLNYNFGGDLSKVFEEVTENAEDLISGADNKAGFHLGLWSRIHFMGLYLRPEINYTQLNNSYNNIDQGVNTDFKTKKIDVPILIGTKIIGPVHIFAGPAIQYITKSDFSQSEFENITTNDFSVGLQIGTGLELGRFGVDVRWEKGFSNKLEGNFVDDGDFLNTGIKVDNRPNQIIFAVSYKFNNKRR